MATAGEKFSTIQIDQLGDRLRVGPASEADLVILDEFRRSFVPAYEIVVDQIRELKLETTGRPAKTTPSIIDQLKREPIRLTQIQDIAGCRIVVPDTSEQNRVVESLSAKFPRAAVVDRRKKPQHGYRAVHVVAHISGLPVEIQVRTDLQHRWAELSEKLADVFDSSIKYGGGPQLIKDDLKLWSQNVAELEDLEPNLLRPSSPNKELFQSKIAERKSAIAKASEDLITWLVSQKG